MKKGHTIKSRRNFITSLAAVAGSMSIAGCSSDDVNPPQQVTPEDNGDENGGNGGDSTTDGGNGSEQEDEPSTEEATPQTAEAALGDIIDGDRLALAAYEMQKTTEIDEFTAADSGNEFIVVDMAAKNKSGQEFISFSSFFQITLQDSESYEYDQSFTGADNTIGSGELAPGEVTRGIVVFEVPQGTTGLTLNIDLDESLFIYSGAEIDLESQGSGRTLTQDLQIPIYNVGDTVEFQSTRFTINDVGTSMGGQYTEPDQGNEYVVADITVENNQDEELSISTLLQMELKDAEGRSYTVSFSGTSSLDRAFSQGQPIAAGSERRGEIAFEVEKGLAPLYLVMDFDYFAEGDKTFFQIR